MCVVFLFFSFNRKGLADWEGTGHRAEAVQDVAVVVAVGAAGGKEQTAFVAVAVVGVAAAAAVGQQVEAVVVAVVVEQPGQVVLERPVRRSDLEGKSTEHDRHCRPKWHLDRHLSAVVGS